MSNYYQNSSGEDIIISTVVAVDKDKNSQFAVKWAIEKLRLRNNQIILVHVRIQHSFDSRDAPKEGREPTQTEMQQLFLQYRSFCARKGIRVKEVILQDMEVADALSNYIRINSITTVVLGASSRGAIARAFKNTDVPTSVGRCAPDSCAVYVVSKGKVQKLKSSNQPDTPRSATSSGSSSGSVPRHALFPDSPAPTRFRLLDSWKSTFSDLSSSDASKNTSPLNPVGYSRDYQQITPIEKPQESATTSYESIVVGSNYSSSQNSGESDHMTPPPTRKPSSNISAIIQSMNNLNLQVRTKESTTYSLSSSDHSEVQSFPSDVSFEILDHPQTSDSSRSSTSSQAAEIGDELRRLKQEMKQITLKYNVACQDVATARDKVRGIAQWKSDNVSTLEEAKHAQEAALAMVEKEKLKCKIAIEVAYKAQRIAELESEKRKHAEMKFRKEAEEKQKVIDAFAQNEIRYRRYTMNEIEVATNYFSDSEKIGEGGYGPVFKATLDHTPVAIKVLRPDISQGEKQFQREVEVLSRMRHPHMVILLGACPEYGCLVYEYMDNGSLEDRLYRRDGTRTLPWSTRFRIAAEIATALNFLHRTRPEPLVHRDLKPANILLDRNYVSKISDVGLARLVPPSVANGVTQYHMTAAAGTFCYIDPEYQQTGMLGTKSDIYSLGVILLQIITAKPAMGLTYHVETAIETAQFAEILDQTVKDWPVEEALSLAKLALKCCELRRKDRPDLDSEILPELQRLRDLG